MSSNIRSLGRLGLTGKGWVGCAHTMLEYTMALGMDGEWRRGSEARDVTSCLMIPVRCAAENAREGGDPVELIMYLSSGDEWTLGIFGRSGDRACWFFFFLGSLRREES